MLQRGSESHSLAQDKIVSLLFDTEVARGVDPEHLGEFVAAAKVVRFDAPDSLVVAEGEVAESFYVVLEGEVRVERSGASGGTLTLTTLGPGQAFGEAALLDEGGVRGASVRTVGGCTRLLVLQRSILATEGATAWVLPLLLNLAGAVSNRLAETNRATVAALEARQAESARRISLAHFLGWVVGVLCLYTLSLSLMYTVTDSPVIASLCTNAAIFASAFGMYRFLKKTPFSIRAFGLSWPKRWGAHLAEAIVWAVALSALVTAVKWLVVPAGGPLFEPRYLDPQTPGWLVGVVAVAYFMLAPIQEFIVRGTLQSALELFLDEGRYRAAYAIGMSNLIFSAYHAHLSASFALGAFVLGLFWGVLYLRQRSVFGVAVCHALVGTYAIQVLGVETFR